MAESILQETRRGWYEHLPRSVLGMVREGLLDVIDRIEWGCIEVHDSEGARTLGRRDNPGPRVSVQVHDEDFWGYMGLGGSVGAGQSYFLGLWDTDDLVDLVRILVRNRFTLDHMDRGFGRIGMSVYRWFHARRENTLAGSRDNIAAHYDLGNDFYELMLDRTMMYSSAIYADEHADLETAQRHKLDVICDKLLLGPDVHVLEIGTGWGGFAVHAAARHGCRVTTTTISRQQHDYAVARVRAAGLEHLVTVLEQDYRHLEGRFDRIVSIEMIEAVGHQYFDTYFRRLEELLAPEGFALIQAITIEDRKFEQYRDSVDFIRRFVFPGGCLPSVTRLVDSMRRVTKLRVRHLEDISDHYARTLGEWQRNVDAHADRLVDMGYDRTFQRLWRYYLAFCQGGFMERSIGDVQMIFEKADCRAPSPVMGVAQGFVPDRKPV
ncbi:MAG: cyclopropane-fatty-acyl-phospholipid synthase family protein [Pseudomonadales bacterium]|jgi:cyclopropane-fatty-acyl-phospholipid synthase|nr:cyclopropane-fatty-acyl-phospholipid synthase family protein [Pseudomonadales bacterium]